MTASEQRPPEPPVGQATRPLPDSRPAVCMFVYNNCLTDQRVLKQARTVARAGYRVTIVAVLDRKSVPLERHPEFTIIRIDRDPIHYRLLRRSRRARAATRARRSLTRRILRRLRTQLRASGRRTRGVVRRSLVRVPRLVERVRFGRGVQGTSASCEDDWELAPRSPARAVILAAAAPFAVGYRAVRWRARRKLLRARRRLRRVSIGGESLRLRRARGRVRRRLDLDPERISRRARVGRRARRIHAPGLHAPMLHAPSWTLPRPRPLQALDRAVSRAAYRWLMAFHRPLMFTDYYRRAFRAVAHDGYSVFQAHDVITLPVAAWAAYRTRGRLVYDSHELYSEVSTLSARERRTWAALERVLIRRADRVLTVCDSIADELVQRYSVRRPTILLNCPPQSAAPPELADGGRLRAQAELAQGVPIILYQGGYAPNRGIEELIDAVPELEHGVLVLMGWGALEEELKNRVRRARLSDRVRMIGPARPEELLQFTVGADVGVIPYRAVGLNNYYTTPNKLFEYIAAGVPVAGSAFPELRRVIEEGRIGVTFDPDDPHSIAASLNHLLADADSLRELRINTREAAKRYVWEREAPKLLDIYSDLLPIGAGTPLPPRRP